MTAEGRQNCLPFAVQHTLSGTTDIAGNSAKMPTAPGTNSLGTANSVGSPASTGNASAASTTTVGRAGSGGVDVTGPSTTGDAAVSAEDKLVDKKIKSICRGC
jgi:hypothetical protein